MMGCWARLLHLVRFEAAKGCNRSWLLCSDSPLALCIVRGVFAVGLTGYVSLGSILSARYFQRGVESSSAQQPPYRGSTSSCGGHHLASRANIGGCSRDGEIVLGAVAPRRTR